MCICFHNGSTGHASKTCAKGIYLVIPQFGLSRRILELITPNTYLAVFPLSITCSKLALFTSFISSCTSTSCERKSRQSES